MQQSMDFMTAQIEMTKRKLQEQEALFERETKTHEPYGLGGELNELTMASTRTMTQEDGKTDGFDLDLNLMEDKKEEIERILKKKQKKMEAQSGKEFSEQLGSRRMVPS